MEELFQLRMQEHELSMRQMVEEIHRGQLNIGQAAAKFKVTRQTVKHWLDKVEGEAATANEQIQVGPTMLPKKKKRKSPRSVDQSVTQVEELQARVFSLEQELEAAKFKAIYYSTLVRVAEQELGIDIEKNFVTGSPRPSYGAATVRFMQVNYPNVHIRQLERLLAAPQRDSADKPIINTGNGRYKNSTTMNSY
ncbi:helix-turn-helix domain-containing protein [Cesiribacter sp. SM1]|uniref:helix-turn-helix domain-containing protein n=1 Tax=Cesiribacter sp. SM1 TaxID=2861196 RepID=UPI001CD5A60C|nr:helix-turn-helix domain-containing protein [Cesiribacter sp. SM1]